MTEEEIIKGNRIILDFMDAKYNERVDLVYMKDLPMIPLSGVLFHSDWNWIMLVVEKIEDLAKCTFGFFESAYFIDDRDDIIPEINNLGNSKIESVWLSCIEAIKKYNKQNNG